MIINEQQKDDINTLAMSLYESASNFHWLTGSPTLELESLESQYEVLRKRMEAIRLKLTEFTNETR